MIDSVFSCQSEAIFGSSARRDVDRLSDRDYFIVDVSSTLRHMRRLHLEQLGWSVASYSWERMKRLIRRKALFAQHLKLEALVVKDDDDRLKHTLSQYAPASGYRADMDATGAAIMAVVGGSHSVCADNWAFDVLAVNVRNLAILCLADQGEYLFDYDAVVRRLTTTHGLLDTDAENLLLLRELKARYRQGEMLSGFSKTDRNRVLSSVQRCLERVRCSFSQMRGAHGFLDYSGVGDPYLRSRLIERDVLRSRPRTIADQEEWELNARSLLAKASRPRDYLWKFVRDSKTETEIEILRQIASPRDEPATVLTNVLSVKVPKLRRDSSPSLAL